MFSNRFNNTKNDPLVEAVQNAMQDGEIRRQAVAYVNEAFGVYNRNAVVREQLADYDAAIEEAYKCMKEAPDTGESDARKTVTSSKEAKEKVFAKHKERVKKLADKDYDKDGKVESPKDEVWGSRFRAAKMAGKMEEEQIDEISKGTLGSYVGKSANANYGKEKLEREKGVKLAMKKISGKGVKVKATNEETDYSAPDRAAVTRDNKPSTPAQTNAATSGPSAADKAALASKISTMKEAASHGARELTLHAANDIGKPGKEFKRIAKSAAARYGSEERGKKVAGAILSKIRAKHMKEENLEELSAFGAEFAKQRASGAKEFSFGGKSYSTAMKGSSSAPKTAPKSSGPQNNPGLGGAVKSGQFATRDTTPIPTRSPAQQQAKVDAANIRANKSAIPNPTISSPKITGTASGAGNVQSATGPRGEIRPGSSADYAQKSGGVLPMPTGGKPVGNDDVTGMVKNINKNPSAVASVNAANKPDSSSGNVVDRARSAVSSALGIKPSKPDESDTSRRPMNESVQVGANKYRII